MSKHNRNRPGYKHTKVGWIPGEWECIPFTRLFKRVSKSVNVEPTVTYREIGIRSHCKGVFLKENVYGKNLGNKRVFWCQPGALVFNIVFAWEQAVAILGQETEGLIASHRFPMYRAKSGRANEMFYLWFFRSARGKNLLTLASPGGAGRNKTLGQGEMDYLFLPAPPLPEQERIAKVLSAWDQAIELMGKLIEAKQRLKKGLMQQLLTGRIRFPEFEPRNKRKKIDKSKLPKEWKWKKLGECLDKILGGGTPSKNRPHYWNGDIPWATVKDISRGNIGDTIDHISIDGLKESSSNLIPPGTVLMCTRMAVGKTICFECATAINQDLKALFPNKLLNKDFLLVLLRFHENYFASLGGGSTVTGIRLEELRDFRFPLPTIQEQINIASCLSAIDREIQLLTRKRNLLQEQKKGLMQKLLTGEIRVKVEK